ncbi:MAG TPA: zf-HC2 domain-containing protein [Caldithrix abyssi]|uniref:Zf-HC2 domain-containing protein n=1 Tax=Caldithrix abyssi TaxID=187145 RepID=A0A7V5LJ64_CALAY|nr:zf-HC2 domain-containing protein [Caldisericaceae bacterium]HHE55808.1 zf-HC2 domain-containing protein [Caldithrix abyssi]
MISCDTAKRMLSDYIESNLPSDEQAAVDDHLNHCPDCKRVFDDVIFLTAKLHQLPPITTSGDFDSQLRLRISGGAFDDSPSTFSRRNLTFGLSGAALIAMITFFILTTINTPTGEFNESATPSGGINQTQQQMASPILAQPSLSKSSVHEFQNQQDSVKKNPARINQDQLKLVDQEKH